MAESVTWKECIEKNIVSKTEPDMHRARALQRMAKIRFEFWDKPIDDKFIALKIEAYYEIIKELIFAHLYKNGFNCTNHLCLVAYLRKNFPDFDFEIQKIDELRKVRNEITYRGFQVRKDYLDRNEIEFKHIIQKLKFV